VSKALSSEQKHGASWQELNFIGPTQFSVGSFPKKEDARSWEL